MSFRFHRFRALEKPLSEDELRMLNSYGPTAVDLERGALEPSSDKHKRFLDVSEGRADPQTKWEFLWLKYRLLVQADEKIFNLWRERGSLQSEANSFSIAYGTELEKRKSLEKKVEELEELVGALRMKMHKYEVQLGLAEPDPPKDPYRAFDSTGNDWREQS